MLKNAFFVFGMLHMVVSMDTMEMGNFFEGDIMGIAPSLLNSRSGQRDKRYRWPNATVSFEFEPGFPSGSKTLFYAAANHISARSCVRFVPRTNEFDFVRVGSGHGCSSYVGRIMGPQPIQLSEGCTFGNYVHELIHALGFFHEQSRPDRDSYVQIHPENICPGAEHNFEKHDETYVTTFNISYDHGSIMHYGSKGFSCNGEDTITTIPPGIPIGQRKGMSDKDILKVNTMYECNNNNKKDF